MPEALVHKLRPNRKLQVTSEIMPDMMDITGAMTDTLGNGADTEEIEAGMVGIGEDTADIGVDMVDIEADMEITRH